jgi:hypothetical protein
MLSTREAIEIGRRGSQARQRNLSPERRSEIASWAQFIRKQKAQGAVTVTEQMQRAIQIVRAENPDLAAFLKGTSRMPMKYSEHLAQALSDEEKQTIERAWQKVVSEG